MPGFYRRRRRSVAPRRRVRRFRRRTTPRVRRNRRFVKRVVRSMAEKKFTLQQQTYTMVALSTGGFAVRSLWDEPLQAAEALAGAANAGANRNTRIGNKIQTSWMQFRAYINYTGDLVFAPNAVFRIAIFTWRHGTVPTTWAISDIFQDVTLASQAVNAPYEYDNIRILKSWHVKVGAQTTSSTTQTNSPGLLLKYSKKFVRNMTWYANGPDLNTTQNEPYLAITFVGYSGTNATGGSNGAIVNFLSKISFTDL